MATILTPILNPFAFGRLDNVSPAYDPGLPDNIANQTTGFPVPQKEDLSTPGATPVKEEEMNGVLNFYTNLLFQLGKGFQFTFDQSLSDQIAGYSKGALLWNAVGNNWQVSLIDNNTFNFVTTPSYANDRIHWFTATDTPSITNPDFQNFLITNFSSLDPHFRTLYTVSQRVTSDVTNGHMQNQIRAYEISGTTIVAESFLTQDWNVGKGSLAQPTVGSGIYLKDDTSLRAYMYSDSADDRLHYDVAIYENDGTTINNGYSLDSGRRMNIDGPDNLIIEPNSVMCSKDFIPIYFQDLLAPNQTTINGEARWNGVFWLVNLTGAILALNSPASATHTAVFNLALLNISGVDTTKVNRGPITIYDEFSLFGSGFIETFGSNGLQLQALSNNVALQAELYFNIQFQCSSVTPL